MEILYEDKHIIVCIKPAGIPSEGQGSIVEQLSAQRDGAYVALVHRLDTGVGGCMVFAKTKNAAAKLSAIIQEKKMTKEYLAVVQGVPEKEEDTLCDLLFKDSSKNKSFVVKRPRRGVKDAKLFYRTLQSVDTDNGKLSLVRVHLFTGRTHQIRVQFSSRRLPLFGDGKYGGRSAKSGIALWSCLLAFPHPESGKDMVFAAQPPVGEPWTLFGGCEINEEMQLPTPEIT